MATPPESGLSQPPSTPSQKAEPVWSARDLLRSPSNHRSVTPTITPTDGELLMLFTKHGDEEALTRIIERHGPMVWRVCRGVLLHQQDAEDSYQATFLILARNARSIRAGESIAGWLYRVAHRTAISARRRSLKRREETLAQEPPAPPEKEFPDLIGRQMVGLLLEELHRLPAKYQTPLVMRYLEGRSRRAIADATDTTIATVQGQLARGKKLLRSRLVRRGVSLSAAMAIVGGTSRVEATPVHLITQTTADMSALALGSGSLAASATVLTLYREGARLMFFASLTKPALATTGVLLMALLATPLLADGNEGTAPVPAAAAPTLLLDASVTEPAIEAPPAMPLLIAQANPGGRGEANATADSSSSAKAEAVYVEAYFVADLVNPNLPKEEALEELNQWLQQTVPDDTWGTIDGKEQTIRNFFEKKTLVISATQEVHEQLTRTLEFARRVGLRTPKVDDPFGYYGGGYVSPFSSPAGATAGLPSSATAEAEPQPQPVEPEEPLDFETLFTEFDRTLNQMQKKSDLIKKIDAMLRHLPENSPQRKAMDAKVAQMQKEVEQWLTQKAPELIPQLIQAATQADSEIADEPEDRNDGMGRMGGMGVEMGGMGRGGQTSCLDRLGNSLTRYGQLKRIADMRHVMFSVVPLDGYITLMGSSADVGVQKVHKVDPLGMVDLGEPYGVINIGGKTFAEAQRLISGRVNRHNVGFREVQVQVLPGKPATIDEATPPAPLLDKPAVSAIKKTHLELLIQRNLLEKQREALSNQRNMLEKKIKEEIKTRPFGASRGGFPGRNADYGYSVELLQKALNEQLYPSPHLSIDGDYGPMTKAAIRRFQKQADIKANGNAGPETRKALGLTDPPVDQVRASRRDAETAEEKHEIP